MKSFSRLTLWLPILGLAACAGAPERRELMSPEAAPRSLSADDLLLSERIGAEFARQQGDSGQSLQHLLKAAEVSDDPVHAKAALRAALSESNDPAAAAMLARFSRLAPESSEPRAWAIALALHSGRSEEAWRLARSEQLPKIENRDLAEALAAVPVHERVLPFIERTIAASDDLSTALRWCSFVRRINEPELALILVSTVVNRFPDKPAPFAWRAQLRRELKDDQGAMADFRKALTLDPESRFLVLSLAQLEDANGQSLEAARRVAAILPADDAVVQAQVAYAARSKDAGALEAAYRALQALPDPQTSLRLRMLATVAETLGDSTAAIKWLRKVPAGPEQAEALLRAAVLLNVEGDADEALAILRGVRDKAGAAREALVSSYLIEGNILNAQQDATAARDLYSGAIALVPDDPQLLYARALEHADLGEIAEAEADLRRVLALEPENADAMNALGYTLADQTERYAEALDLIEKAMALKPEDGSILDSMGWVTLRMGKPAEAVAYLRAAFELQQDVEISAHLGEALWANHQRNEARTVWMEAKQREPSNPVLEATLRRHGL